MTSRLRSGGLHVLLALGLLGVLLASTGGPAAQAGEQGSAERLGDAVAFAKQKVYPCLVNIGVVAREFTQGRVSHGIGAGSGVLVSPAGHVVTNFHVAGDASRLTCKLPTGEAIDADVICADPLTDLCIIKLRMEQRADASVPIPFAPLGDSDALRVGDHVMAMGNPLSLNSSVTLGIVSNTARVFTNFTGSSIQTFEFGQGQLTGHLQPVDPARRAHPARQQRRTAREHEGRGRRHQHPRRRRRRLRHSRARPSRRSWPRP